MRRSDHWEKSRSRHTDGGKNNPETSCISPLDLQTRRDAASGASRESLAKQRHSVTCLCRPQSMCLCPLLRRQGEHRVEILSMYDRHHRPSHSLSGSCSPEFASSLGVYTIHIDVCCPIMHFANEKCSSQQTSCVGERRRDKGVSNNVSSHLCTMLGLLKANKIAAPPPQLPHAHPCWSSSNPSIARSGSVPSW